MDILVISLAVLACASAQNQLGAVHSQSPGTFAYRTPYSYAFQGVGGSGPGNGLGSAHHGFPGAQAAGFAGFQGGHAGVNFHNGHQAGQVGNVHHAAATPLAANFHTGHQGGHVGNTHHGAAAALPQAAASYGGILRDTPEVQAAKAAHFKAFNEAAARAAAAPDNYKEPVAGNAGHAVQGGIVAHGGAAPHGGFSSHATPVVHGGVASHGGFPSHAAQGFGASHLTNGAHFAPAVSAAHSGFGSSPSIGNFPPIYAGARHGSAIPLQVQDTPEVAAAKAAHFKAHAQAQRLAGPGPAHAQGQRFAGPAHS